MIFPRYSKAERPEEGVECMLMKGKKEAMVGYVWKKQRRLQVVLPVLGWEA